MVHVCRAFGCRVKEKFVTFVLVAKKYIKVIEAITRSHLINFAAQTCQ